MLLSVRIELGVEYLKVLLLFLFKINLVWLRLEDHVLIETLVGRHERSGEVFIHHVPHAHASDVSRAHSVTTLLVLGQLLLNAAQFDVVEVGLHLELELLGAVNDQGPHRRSAFGSLIGLEQICGKGCLLLLRANNDR